MAEVDDRDALEEKFARQLGQLFGLQASEVTELLGDPPDYTKLSAEFFTAQAGALSSLIAPFLGDLAELSAGKMLDALPFDVDPNALNAALSDWIGSYAYELVGGITDTNRTQLQLLVQQYFDQSWTIGELERQIARLFGARRAETIAVTEVTRAAASGELIVGQLARAQDVDLVPTWNTNRDAFVCPICKGFNGTQQQSGVFFNSETGREAVAPPAHPRCRCWVTHTLRVGGKKVLEV